jgi:hypothetical protein
VMGEYVFLRILRIGVGIVEKKKDTSKFFGHFGKQILTMSQIRESARRCMR